MVLGNDPYKWKGLDRIFQVKRIETIIENLKGNSFLEIGCGEGYIIGRIARMNPDARCVGLSNSEIGMREAKIGHPSVEFICKDVYDYVPTEKFDTVILPEVIEHLEDPKKILAKVGQIVNKRIIITVPNRNKIDNSDHVQIYSKDRLESHIRETINPKSFEILPVAKDWYRLRTNTLSRRVVGRMLWYLRMDGLFKLNTNYENALFLVAIVDVQPIDR